MSASFFSGLNYTIGNEDTSFELALLPHNTDHVVAVAGSGARVVPLLARNPCVVTCVDSSPAQLALCEIRLALVRELTREEYLAFWGYPPAEMDQEQRKEVCASLVLSDAARNWLTVLGEAVAWTSFLYAGKWERTCARLAALNAYIVGKRGVEMFACNTREEQERYFKDRFPHRRWALSLRLLGNAPLFNALMYRGSYPRMNRPGSTYTYYADAFERLFALGLVRENYLLQLLFLGRVLHSDGLPLECREEVYQRAQHALRSGTRVSYVLGDVVETITSLSEPTSFVSLSDTPSYYSEERARTFLSSMRPGIRSGGLLVGRYYLRVPQDIRYNDYVERTNEYETLIQNEKTQMFSYGIFQKH